MKLYGLMTWLALAVASTFAAKAQVPAPTQIPAPNPAWRPTQPIEIWVTFGKGAHADIWAKDIISIIEKNNLSSVPFKVVNIPKGAGLEAFPKFGKLDRDDHKLMLVLPNVFTVPLFRPSVKFDLRTMTPIARMGSETLAIWIKSEKRDVKSIQDLTKAARAKGRDFKIVGPPKGTPRAMLAQMFMALYAIDGTYIGIRRIGSTARKLAEDDFDAAIYNPSEQFKLSDPGVVKPIAFFANKRAKHFLRTPTLPETGLPLTYQASRVIIGPRGMSKAARDYYIALFRKVYESREWQKIRTDNGHLDGFLANQGLRDFLLARIAKHERWKMAVEVLLASD